MVLLVLCTRVASLHLALDSKKIRGKEKGRRKLAQARAGRTLFRPRSLVALSLPPARSKGFNQGYRCYYDLLACSRADGECLARGEAVRELTSPGAFSLPARSPTLLPTPSTFPKLKPLLGTRTSHPGARRRGLHRSQRLRRSTALSLRGRSRGPHLAATGPVVAVEERLHFDHERSGCLPHQRRRRLLHEEARSPRPRLAGETSGGGGGYSRARSVCDRAMRWTEGARYQLLWNLAPLRSTRAGISRRCVFPDGSHCDLADPTRCVGLKHLTPPTSFAESSATSPDSLPFPFQLSHLALRVDCNLDNFNSLFQPSIWSISLWPPVISPHSPPPQAFWTTFAPRFFRLAPQLTLLTLDRLSSMHVIALASCFEQCSALLALKLNSADVEQVLPRLPAPLKYLALCAPGRGSGAAQDGEPRAEKIATLLEGTTLLEKLVMLCVRDYSELEGLAVEGAAEGVPQARDQVDSWGGAETVLGLDARSLGEARCLEGRAASKRGARTERARD